MRKIVLYIAASLDNFIAKPDGDTSWLHSPELAIPNEDYGYADLMARIDTTLMGNKTYEQIMGFDVPFPYPDTRNYVFTRDSAKTDTKHVQFIATDIVSFVRGLRQEAGKDIWLIGGSQINTELLNAGLVDELILSLIPVTLGAGVPLFAEGLAHDFKFHLQASKAYSSGLVQLMYDYIPFK